MYIVAVAKDVFSLMQKVNDKLKEEFQPVGGIVVLPSGNLCQPMLKRKD